MKSFHYKVLLFVFLGVALSCSKTKDKPTVQPPVKVSVIKVSKDGSPYSRTYSGTVAASESTTVSFSVAGTITHLFAKEGQKVSKGQLLGKVRDGEYLNAYNIAQAQLEEAQDGYNRLKKLHDANALPEIKWVEMQQKLKQAQNMADMAKRSLEDASLRSPVAGSVTRKFVDEGQSVMPVEPVYEIVDLNHLTIDIPVSETEVGKFKAGDKATVSIASIDGRTIEGVVSSKSLEADPLTRSFTIKISIPNEDGKIFPGMIGNVVFENKMLDDSTSMDIILPSQAVLLNHDNRWFVWVVEDSVAQRRFVVADELVNSGVSIKSGLNPGDAVIVEGMQKVGSGTKVVTLEK